MAKQLRTSSAVSSWTLTYFATAWKLQD